MAISEMKEIQLTLYTGESDLWDEINIYKSCVFISVYSVPS